MAGDLEVKDDILAQVWARIPRQTACQEMGNPFGHGHVLMPVVESSRKWEFEVPPVPSPGPYSQQREQDRTPVRAPGALTCRPESTLNDKVETFSLTAI